jgi:hypothetical protein
VETPKSPEVDKSKEQQLKSEGISFNCLVLIVFIEQKKLAKDEAEVQKKGMI